MIEFFSLAPRAQETGPSERKAWLLALGYVAFIYATLGVVRIPVTYLRSHGVLRTTLAVFYGLCVLVLILMLSVRHAREVWRYLVFFTIVGLYAAVARRVQVPEEQIHFFEYGLVGVFFARALRIRWGKGVATFLAALALAALAGWVDELLQGRIPNRHYDVRDIALNVVSAGLGLWVYQILPAPRTNRLS